LAALISASVALGVAFMIQQNAVPPGGDPGTWLSTAKAYVGQNVPTQAVPLAYPPVLFPLLGLAILGTGGPIAAAQVFAPTLYFVLGLAIFYLATQMFQSRVVALVTLTFVLLDPQLLQMVFWGAYPNLLGFVFLYLAFAGLILVGKGSGSRGAAMFWVFASLAVLTHSLTGLVLAGTTLLALFLSWPLLPSNKAGTPGAGIEPVPDSPRRLLRGLVGTLGGQIGLIGSAAVIGGYYLVTALARVTHPAYFVSKPLAFQVISLGGSFRALFPGFRLVNIAAVYLLVFLVIVLLMFYAIALQYRPTWLTTPVILLVANGITVLVTPVVGWFLRIVTDYGRFSFFLLVPAALSIGYAIDRGWVSARSREPAGPVLPAPTGPERTHRRWLRGSRHPRRVVALVILWVVIGVVIVASVTAPAMRRYERSFAGLGHDQEFLQALHAIEQTKIPGNILTVQGADKWARAITDRNSFAPYAQASLLFYQTQILDSQLAYYALSSHYAVTNGLVSGQIRGIVPSNLVGIPGYGIYTVGAFHPVLSIPPALISIELVGAMNQTAYALNLTGVPAVALPPSSGGGPLEVVYTSSRFVFTTYITVAPSSPQLDVNFSVVATSSDLVRYLNVTMVPAATTSARVWPVAAPGEFDWVYQERTLGLVTDGNVTPTGALRGVTNLDPQTSSPAVILSFNSTGARGSQGILGSLSLATPGATTLYNELPPVVITPQIWSQLGIRFILMTNPTYGPAPTAEFPGEVAYLQSEYGLPIVFQNSEWSVLEVPKG